MIEIAYHQTNFEELLKHFARLFKVKVNDNTIDLPPDIGQGFLRVITVAGDMQVLISNYTFNQDILFKRNKIAKELYSFRFDEMAVS